MQQISPSTALAQSPQGKPAFRFAAIVPHLVIFIWLVAKQYLALKATGLWAGPAMVAASAGILLVVTAWLLRTSGRKLYLWAFFIDLFLTCIVYADVVYFRQFSDLVSVASLRFALQLADVGGSVAALMKLRDLLLFIDLPILLICAILPPRAPKIVLPWKRVISLVLVGLLLLVGEMTLDPVLKDKFYGHSNVASRMGLLNYHVYDMASYASRFAIRLVPSAPAVSQVNDWFANRTDLKPNPLYGTAKGKNVIFIQVESLQAFALGLQVNGQAVTPNLDKLAGESIYFKDHYTQIGQGVTSDADLLGNCSLYPTRTGAVYYDYAANDYRCMPTLLRENGYHAYAFQGMPADFWNLQSVYPHIGFEQYYSASSYDLSEKLGIGLSDESFFKQSIEKLKNLPQPYYAYLVTLTSHGPFKFPGMPQALPLGDLQGTMAGDYLQAVHYTDAAIGHFVDALRQQGMLDNAVLVLDGDHGGIFRNNSGMPELLKIPATDEVGWTQVEKRVPLIIRLPGGQDAGERTYPTGHIGIAPTVADLLGVPTNTVHFTGWDLLTNQDPVIAFSTGSAMTKDKLFWAREDMPQGLCYSRQTGATLPPDSCAEIAKTAATELNIGRTMIERNLIPKLQNPWTLANH